MKTYLYRLIDTEQNKYQDVGLAVANDTQHLLDILSEFCDPYAYQFCLAQPGDAVSTRYGEPLSEKTNLHANRQWLQFIYPFTNKTRPVHTDENGNSIPQEKKLNKKKPKQIQDTDSAYLNLAN